MKKLTEAMKQMLDALAFAHAGDYLTRREKARVLNQASGQVITAPPAPEPVNAPARRNARRIALYLGSELPSDVMEYVIQTCARLQRELTVLTFQGENTGRALLAPHREALKAAEALDQLGRSPTPTLLGMLKDGPSHLRHWAAEALAQHPVYALQADLEARGLTSLVEGIQVISYEGFVELVEQHHVVPWL